MSTDIAIDYNTGDLVVSPTNDFSLRTGLSTIEQSIRVRLRIIQGSWYLDPTSGRLGSRLYSMLREPAWKAMGEIPLVIREALEPMEEISVVDVNVTQDPDDIHALNVLLRYVIREEGEDENTDVQVFETTVLTEG